MIKQRIVEFKDDNGDSHFKCQHKGWFFWWYYRHPSPYPAACISGSIREYDTIIQANAYLKVARGQRRRKSSVIKESDIPDYEWGSNCSIGKYEKLKESLKHFDK